MSILIIPTFVLAEEKYYTNENGVSLTKKEYDFISEMYYEGFQKYVTKELYDDLKSDDIFSQPIEKKVIEINPGLTRSDFIEDSGRILSITKSCASNCLVTSVYEWKGRPSVRTYDVMGAYFENTTLQNSPFTMVTSSAEQGIVTEYKKEQNGLGCSFKVHDASDMKVTQSFRVAKGGHVYASYQHAMKTAWLVDSQDYTFSYYGYGRVFKFSEKSAEIYDAMNGVDIEV